MHVWACAPLRTSDATQPILCVCLHNRYSIIRY